MTTLYALVGSLTNELLTYQGAVITHDSEAELQFLVPGVRVIALPRADLGRPLMRFRDHPSMAAVQWPLQKEDFR